MPARFFHTLAAGPNVAADEHAFAIGLERGRHAAAPAARGRPNCRLPDPVLQRPDVA
jgi:hypothetical protein